MISKSLAFSKRPNVNAAIFATLSALSLSISMSFAKQLSGHIPTSLVVFVRSLWGLVFFIPFLLQNKTLVTKTHNLPLHILRVTLVVGAMLCTYYTYRNLPIAFATSIGMTGALFTTVLSGFILREKIGLMKWILIIIGYFGVILVIRPTSFILEWATIVALMANLLSAICIIIIKILSKRDSTITIMLYSNIGITVISGLLNIGKWQPLSIRDILILSCTGLLGISTQFCSITALKFSTPSFIAPFEYTRMFFAIMIGIIIFGEIPNVITMLGSFIIVMSTYLLTILESRKK